MNPSLLPLQKKIGSFLLTLAVIALAGLFLWAEEAGASPDFTGTYSGYKAELYDIGNGLPTSEANDIAQTSEGFIWIGSYGGLIRYDGKEFYEFRDVKGLANVISLFVDSRDRLIIGTNDSGLVVLDGEEDFRFYTRDEGLRSSTIKAISEDGQGCILFASSQGIGYLDSGRSETLHMIDDERINDKDIVEFMADGDGLIYGLTAEGDVFTVRDRKIADFCTAEELGQEVIQTIYPDPEKPGFIYLGTDKNRIVYGDLAGRMKESRTFETGKQEGINTISRIKDRLWVTSNEGIGYLDRDGKYTAIKDIPMNNAIDHVMADQEGNLWFTSWHQGVMKIVENRFNDISTAARLPEMIVNCTCVKDGDLYIGGEEGLVVLDAGLKEKENAAAGLLEGERIRSVVEDSKGDLWISSNGDHGLVRYDPKTDQIRTFTEADGLASAKPRVCLELSDGRMAVATSAGVNIIEGDAIVDTIDEEDGVENARILSLAEGSGGELYMGTDGDGIYVMKKGRVSRIGFGEGLPSEVVMRMKKDPLDEDLIWLITGNSVAFLKDGKATAVREFPYSNNFDLYFNDDGQIWILSGNGVYVVNREDMLANGEIIYAFYDGACGLPSIATANSYSALTDDGTLYISGTTGVAGVNINDESGDVYKVHLTVPFLMSDGKYIDARGKSKVKIPAECHRLTIEAHGFTYTLNNPSVTYFLKGSDKEPVVTTARDLRNISYTNLKGGTYDFHLAQIDPATSEEIQSYDLTIVKTRMFYEYLWFKILCGLLVAAAIFFSVTWYFRRKTRILRKKEEENRKMIEEMATVFAKCIDMKDAYTNGHSVRVAYYSCLLAERMGKSPEEIEKLHNIALLHDIGKISIPDNILNKPGRLDDEEFAIMKSHSARGRDILSEVSIAPDLAIGAGSHHERMDGKGYPEGLTGDEIPEFAQIISVADTFDAMFSTRPYRKKMPLDDIVREIKRCAGTQFNAEIAGCLLELIEEGVISETDRGAGDEPEAADGSEAAERKKSLPGEGRCDILQENEERKGKEI